MAEDAFGDHATVLCEFGYGPVPGAGARHGIAVHVDRVAQGAAVDVTLVDDVDAAELELRLGADHADDEFRRVEPGWAGAVLEQAFARTDLIASTPVAPSFAALRALALARVRALPSTPLALSMGPDSSLVQREAVVAEFSRSPEVAALPAPLTISATVVEQVAGQLLDFATKIDPGDLLRVSPGRIEAFMFDWLPAQQGTYSPEQVTAIVRAWAAWAARQGGTPLLTRDALARAVDDILDERLAQLRPRPVGAAS